MSVVLDKQISVHLNSNGNEFNFSHDGKDLRFPTRDKVHTFFQNKRFDTVKFSEENKKTYVHFGPEEMQVFDTKKALRKTLSSEFGGTWIEEKNGKRRYFVDDCGWFCKSYKQVTKEEFLQRLNSLSTMQKVLGIGLGILALAPGVSEWVRNSPVGTNLLAIGLNSANQKSTLLGIATLIQNAASTPSSTLSTASIPPFLISTTPPSGTYGTSIAELSNQGFFAVWDSWGYGEDSYEIVGQKYFANGSVMGPEMQINTYSMSGQYYPQIAKLENGGVLVVWQSWGQDGDRFGVYGQRFNPNVTRLGPEFQINTYTIQNQENPVVASLKNGGFVVTWQSLYQDGDSYGIFAQRFDLDGTPLGNEFQVNSNSTNLQSSPTVAGLEDGGFVISWIDGPQSNKRIFTRRYDLNGTAYGQEFEVTSSNDFLDSHSATGLSDGGFLITWGINNTTSIQTFGKRFVSNSTGLGTEFLVNSDLLGNQRSSKAVALTNDNFIVIWYDNNNTGIFGQKYQLNGTTIGSNFQVISNLNGSAYGNLALSKLSGEEFIVSWIFGSRSLSGIFGQRFDQNLNPLGGNDAAPNFLATSGYPTNPTRTTSSTTATSTEFQVNSFTSGNQFSPVVTTLSDGGFLIVWVSEDQDSDGDGIFGQRFDQMGLRVGSEFQINTNTTGDQNYPDACVLFDGRFVITWTSDGQDGDRGGIFGQHFDSSGLKTGSEFQVNSYSVNSQSGSKIASFTNGGFAILWSSWGQDGDNGGVFGQRYNSSAEKLGNEFQVNSISTGSQGQPDAAALSNGGFIVAWDSYDLGVYGGNIFTRRFDANGTGTGPESRVNPSSSFASNDQYIPSIKTWANGEAILSWTGENQDWEWTYGVFAQKYNSTGAPIGGEFQVNTLTEGNQEIPKIAILSDNTFVIVWCGYERNENTDKIFGQRYDQNGTPIQTEFRVSTQGSAIRSSIAPLEDGGFIVVWQSLDGVDRDIFAKRYDANGTEIALTPIDSPFSATVEQTHSQLNTISPPPTELIIHSVIDIIYLETYSIVQNGQIVGTFSFSGGTGTLDSNNANILNIRFNQNYAPQPEEPIPLFSIPQGQESAWQNIQIGDFDLECLEPLSEINPSSSGVGNDFQLIFTGADSCISSASLISASIMAITSN